MSTSSPEMVFESFQEISDCPPPVFIADYREEEADDDVFFTDNVHRPSGPPQPQKISVKHVMRNDEMLTETSFSNWKEWDRFPVDLNHVEAVACLQRRELKIVESPFEKQRVLAAQIDSNWRYFTPHLQNVTSKRVFVMNDRLPRGFYNYNAYEGEPIFIEFRNLGEQEKAVRDKKAREKRAKEMDDMGSVMSRLRIH